MISELKISRQTTDITIISFNHAITITTTTILHISRYFDFPFISQAQAINMVADALLLIWLNDLFYIVHNRAKT